MNNLLIFFAIPIAVIIISIALQKILKCPALVAAIIFAIFLIVTFVVNNLNLLIATIIYAIISFITAYAICLVGRIIARIRERNTTCGCQQNEQGCTYQITSAEGLNASVNIIPNTNNNNSGCNNNNGTNSNCCCQRRGL